MDRHEALRVPRRRRRDAATMTLVAAGASLTAKVRSGSHRFRKQSGAK
jgi:hypothetical protein